MLQSSSIPPLKNLPGLTKPPGKKKAPAAEIQEKVGDTTVTVANSEYEDWLAADQQVLSFILTSVTKEVLVRIATTKTPADAWKILEE
jgi:hypothetical protein